MGNKITAKELRTRVDATDGLIDLRAQLDELKGEMAGLQVARATGGAASKVAKIRATRRSIARVLTIMNQAKKAKLHQHYKGKPKPYDLRMKLTRKVRRELSDRDSSRTTLRTKKHEINFPARKFAYVPNLKA